MRTPQFKHLIKFCEREGYVLKSNNGKHFKYIKKMDDGTILRTGASKAPNKDIPPRVFNDILKNQICVKEEYFWKVVLR